MASKSEDLSCPICLDIYKDPVIMTCSHSFCTTCLQQFWQNKNIRKCPVCERRCSKTHYPPNLALRNLCDAFLKDSDSRASPEPNVRCSSHKKKLRLFCQEDQQPVCLLCRDSKLHKGHNFSPIDEAVPDRKDELKGKLKPLQEKRDFENVKVNCEQTAQHIQVQADHTEAVIKEEFEKLHQFLRNEEAVRIAALKMETMQKSQMMKDKIEKISKEISSLTDIINAIEETMESDDISFLQNYKSTTEKAQFTLQIPEPPSGALIQVAKHLGNLKFRVWEKMQSIANYTPVILDPNTAYCRLSLSNDLTTVRFSEVSMEAPPGPERFDSSAVVLGSEGFSSGRHSWDVKVGESTNWALGVMEESAPRTGNITSRTGLWRIWYYNGQYRVGSTPGASTLLTMMEKPQWIRVQLDWDAGKVSFFEPEQNVHLHTLTHTFTERVFPLINATCKVSPLKIMPLKTSVTTQ